MTATFDIAVIGATGTVGETLVEILQERDFPVGELFLLASAESAGAQLAFRGKNRRVRAVNDFDFGQVKLAFFCAGEAVSRSHAARALAAGCSVIDLAGGLEPGQGRMLVPELNGQVLDGLAAPVALSSPTPATVAVATALAPLRGLVAPKRVSITACLAVSALGREAVTELARQTTSLLNMKPLEPALFDRQVAFNVLAQVGAPDAEGHTRLERRLVAELRELLQWPTVEIAVNCIQVPVFFGDSLSVSLQDEQPLDLAEITAALESGQGLEVVDAPDYPTAVGDAVGQDAVYVGRIRGGIDDPRQLNFWLTCDNGRKGAALNAVQMAELLIKPNL